MGIGAAAGAPPAAAETTAERPADCPIEDSAEDSDGEGGETRRDVGGHLTAEQAAAYDRALHAALRDREGTHDHQSQQRTEVPVAVHIVHAEDGTGDVDDGTVREQIDVLDTAFGGGYSGADTGFDFRLEDLTRTADDAWFDDFAAREDEIKSSLRQGGAETLNLYIARLGEGVLGRATFPQEHATDLDNDGVAVDHRTVPDGGREGFDLGYTAVHETGHWLGLFHTFQNGCTEPGDYVDDTPYEAEQSSGCPEGRDTCPARDGADPVHNFMNYSDDPCLNHFTSGQGRRMSEHWTAFRADGASDGREPQAPTAPLPRQ